jgi:hypothetical protein
MSAKGEDHWLKSHWNYRMVHDEMLMRRGYEVFANGKVLDEVIWVQNDVNVMEVNYEETDDRDTAEDMPFRW